MKKDYIPNNNIHFSNNHLDRIISKNKNKNNQKINFQKSKSYVDINNDNSKNNNLKFDFSCNFHSRMNRQILKNMNSSTDKKISMLKSQIINSKSIDSKLDNFYNMKSKFNNYLHNHKYLFFKRQICKKEAALDQLILMNKNYEDEYDFNNNDFYLDDDEKNNSIEKVIIDNKIIYSKNRLTSDREKKKVKNKSLSFFEDKYYAKKNQILSKKKYNNLIKNNIKILPYIKLNLKKKENKSFSKQDFNNLLQLNQKNHKIITNQFLNKIYKEIQNSKKGIKKINNQVNLLYNQSKVIFDIEMNNINI